MSQLGVTINGRSYSIACDDGQEAHLTKLAAYLDTRVGEIAATMGQVGDARLLLIAGLLIADELSDANARVAEMERYLSESDHSAEAAASENSENAAADILDRVAQRIESVAARLERA